MLTEYEIILLFVAWICSVAGAFVMGSKHGYSECEREFKMLAGVCQSILNNSDIKVKDLNKEFDTEEDNDDGR